MLTETIFRALADSTRLRILRLLASMELSVGELAQVLGQSQPRVSRHVAILCDCGLAERRREGSWVFLRLAREGEGADPLHEAVHALLEAGEGADPALAERALNDRRKLADIRAGREEQAQDYFAANAEQWDELRRMHSPDAEVEAALQLLLGTAPLGRVLDIGTGTGRMAELFAERAYQVVALDKSLAMLRLARARLQHLPTERFEIVQGDLGALPFGEGSFDTVIIHQVLHFTQDPDAALAEAARVTRPGGRVAIVDFAAHAREELREKHAHTRLGFSDRQMSGLLEGSGFEPAPPVALEDGELVVKIWVARRAPAGRDDRRGRLAA